MLTGLVVIALGLTSALVDDNGALGFVSGCVLVVGVAHAGSRANQFAEDPANELPSEPDA